MKSIVDDCWTRYVDHPCLSFVMPLSHMTSDRFFFITLCPAAITDSFVKPNSFCTCLAGAERPKLLRPTCSPSRPVKNPQESWVAASIDTRARHACGRRAFWYSFDWRMKSSMQGMLIDHTFTPSAWKCSWASSIRETSLPDAMRISSGSSPSPATL